MQRIPVLVCALLAALPVAADPLSDLRAVLQRYPAKGAFAASASLQVSGDSQDVAGARGGATSFEVEFGPAGLMIRVPPAALGAAETEAEIKKHNPEHLTPTPLAHLHVASRPANSRPVPITERGEAIKGRNRRQEWGITHDYAAPRLSVSISRSKSRIWFQLKVVWSTNTPATT